MFDDISVATAARTYLLETAPALVLRLDARIRVLDANARARDLLGNGAIGRSFAENVISSSGSAALAELIGGGGVHRLTLKTASMRPETLDFHFLPLPDGTLALGAPDFKEQERLFREALALNTELNDLTRQLRLANAELRDLNETNKKLTDKTRDYAEILFQQSLASQNLMEDAVMARARVEMANVALRESETQLRSLLEGAPDAIFVSSHDRFVYFNAAACRLLGADSEEQILERPVLDFVDPSSYDVIRTTIRAMRDEEKTLPPTEVQWLRIDGRRIAVEVSAVPIVHLGEAATLVFARDISERSAAREALARSDRRNRSILEAAPDAKLVINAEGRIVLVNRQAEKMFGYSRSELLGLDSSVVFARHLREDHVRFRASYFANFREQTAGAAFELTALRADGAEFLAELSHSPLETEEGIHMLAAFRDVTERKETERRSRQLEISAAEAEAASKAKSMFLSTMSHEIRTPMNAIMGYSQLMLRDPQLGADARANLKIINRSGEHLLYLINDVLDIAKIEAGRLELKPIALNLPRLVLDIEAMFRPQVRPVAMQFNVVFSGEPLDYIVADEAKIRQILINLLGNAFKFTEHGRIELSVSLKARTDHRLWLSLAVKDTGVGMTSEDQGRLFEPFVQSVGNLHSESRGTGLGLAISRHVAKAMGGDITFHSALGKGSTFTLEVPVERASAPEVERERVPARRVLAIQAGQVAPRVLIADDLSDNREWLSKLLVSLGFTVRSAENGEAAILEWEKWNPQLILMDIHMPILDGLEACRRIKSRPTGKDTIVIAVTADATESHRKIILDSGANDFISKPCHENELLEKIRAHLGLVYTYDKEVAVVPASNNPRLEQLTEVSGDLREQLRIATLTGDKSLMNELISTIRLRGSVSFARELQAMADAYQYDQLIEWLEKPSPGVDLPASPSQPGCDSVTRCSPSAGQE